MINPAGFSAATPPGLTIWTIYCSPKDYPGEHVAREWRAVAGREVPGLVVARGATAEECRDALDEYLRRIGRGGLACMCRVWRSFEDDPVIVESWL